MSALNPFSARREKKEAALQAKLDQLQQQQQQQVGSELLSGGEFVSAGAQGRTLEYEAEDLDKYLPAAAKVDQPAATLPTPSYQYYEPPSRMRQCFYKLQNGFMIGGALGGAIGFMYGTYASIAHRHILYLPISVVTTAGGFGFFLACGTVIRCEEPPALAQASGAAVAEQRPVLYATKAWDDAPMPMCASTHCPSTRRVRSAVVDAVTRGDE